ncbi:MAG: type B 50S ribosomal protein L31 [Candidatus Campbellbacteria bacterium]|nr:type B 50S ribosomal protein L31 [Candidatus Campbellbacteria bacterium]
MKKDIHPKTHPVIFRDKETNAEFFSSSTMTGEKTEERNGITYQIISVEISSASHPFYTGKEFVVDTAGRVEKFKQRAEKAQPKNTKAKPKVRTKKETQDLTQKES